MTLLGSTRIHGHQEIPPPAALIVTGAVSLAAADQQAAADSPAACQAPLEPWTEILLVPDQAELAGKVETLVNSRPSDRFK